MENELEFDGLDNFDDFGDIGNIDDSEMDFENFEAIDFDLEDVEPIEVRTAILIKNNLTALLCIKTAERGGAICRVDPREANPAVQIYDDAEKALEWYNKSLRSSKKNGWTIAYDGLPMFG
jgi:hypothetical protein